MDAMKITVNECTYTVPEGTTLFELAETVGGEYAHPIVLAEVNGRLRELTNTLCDEGRIRFITTGTRIEINDDICIDPVWPPSGKHGDTEIEDPNENNMVLEKLRELTGVKLNIIAVMSEDYPTKLNAMIPGLTEKAAAAEFTTSLKRTGAGYFSTSSSDTE